MLSRALSLAAVMLLMDALAAERAPAQENLDAGKSPSQIFAGTCNACHKGPRGLLRTVPPGSLSGFLRQHYTTSPAMAGVLANYLISNGATDTRPGAGQPREVAREAKQEGRPSGPPEQGERLGRRQHPLSASQDVKPEPKPGLESPVPAQAAVERGAEGQKLSGKQRLSKRGKPGAEEPKAEESKAEEPGSDKPKEAAQQDAKEEARPEAAVPERASQSADAKAEEPSEASAARADPVAPVTPAREETVTAVVSATPEPSIPAMAAAAVAGGLDVPSVPLPTQSAPSVRAAAPALPPVPPAGPPAPPISQ
jgi:hypothetical protein